MANRRDFRLVEWALLIAVVTLAGVLRFAYLPARGLVYWDEGKFALEGIRLEVLLQALAGGHPYLSAGKAVGTAKPTHALLIGVSYLLLGVHDYSATIMNATASTTGVLMTYVIGRRLFGPGTALLGALFLAVSEYDVIYARSVLSESDANLLLLLAVAVWLSTAVWVERDQWSPRLQASVGALAGATLLGLAFTANYRIAVYAAVFLVLDWTWILIRFRVRGYTPADLRLLGLRVALCVVGFSLAPVAWEILGLVVQSHGINLFHSELTAQTSSYFQEAAYQLHGGKQSVLHFNPLLYVQWWILRQGWPISLLLVGALALAMWRRSYAWLLPASMVLVPYVIYVFAPFAVPRNLVASLPFASILCAQAVIVVARALRRFSVVVVLTCVLVLGSLGGVMSWRLTAERSGFALAARYLEAHAGGKGLTTNEIMVFYLRGTGRYCLAPSLPYHRQSLAAYEHHGYVYAVVDRHHGSPMVDAIERESPKVVTLSALGNLSIGESLISSENSDPPQNDAPFEYVDIYRLAPTTPGGGKPPPCDRDRVT